VVDAVAPKDADAPSDTVRSLSERMLGLKKLLHNTKNNIKYACPSKELHTAMHLQHTAMHLQHTVMHCNTLLLHTPPRAPSEVYLDIKRATRCNMLLLHTATSTH